MLSKELREQLKQFDLVGHPECSHNWVHNAGRQCEWDSPCLEQIINSNRTHLKDSKNLCNIYICTMCGEEYWSSIKKYNIPHYRVKEVKKDGKE